MNVTNIVLGCVAPFVVGFFVCALPTRRRTLGLVCAYLFLIPVYTAWMFFSVYKAGEDAFVWWLVGLGMVAPVWWIAVSVGYLVGKLAFPRKD